MNLIFNEYINFLIDKGLDNQKYNLKEGYYWLDNQIIKAYDIKDINYIKPGIGEATRVLLRRVPWKLLINNNKTYC